MADNIWQTLGKLLLSFLVNKEQGKEEISVSIPIGEIGPVEAPKAPEIDWTHPTGNLTLHFLVGDAITLHSWNRLANESDGLTDEGKARLIVLCQKMEEVRAYLGCGMNVHCMFRSQEYNKEVVKAIPNDVHAQFLAVDFDCGPHMTIQEVQFKMEPVLEKFGIRMERHTDTWVHLDLREPGPSGRYFTP
jgi:hypothetical protein